MTGSASGLPTTLAEAPSPVPAGVVDALAARAAHSDPTRLLAQVQGTGGCARPIRLRGEVLRLNATTGEVIEHYSTNGEPDGVALVACGNRRESVCPACSHTYRYDTYHLVAAGLRGGKGLPESVSAHPRVFATFTAPSFGLVHGVRRADRKGRPGMCRPQRRMRLCPHGRPTGCHIRHSDADSRVGTPLCGDCYDYTAAVLFNAHVSVLWHRFTTYLPRELAALAGVRVRDVRELVKVSYVKVAEYQRRGAIHLHAAIRLDSAPVLKYLGQYAPPGGLFTTALLTAAVQAASARVALTVDDPTAPARPRLLTFGDLDVRPIAPVGDPTRVDTAQTVAGYIGKYVTKSIDAPGIPDRRIRRASDLWDLRCSEHYARLIRTAWEIRHAWAHQLGYGGHIATKSRRYSVTYRELRRARRDNQRARRLGVPVAALADLDGDQVLTVADWRYAGYGHRTVGDAWLAQLAAAQARSYRPAPTR
jgi:hypothetical protein